MFELKICDFCFKKSSLCDNIKGRKGLKKICWTCWHHFGKPKDVEELFAYLRGHKDLLTELHRRWDLESK